MRWMGMREETQDAQMHAGVVKRSHAHREGSNGTDAKGSQRMRRHLQRTPCIRSPRRWRCTCPRDSPDKCLTMLPLMSPSTSQPRTRCSPPPRRCPLSASTYLHTQWHISAIECAASLVLKPIHRPPLTRARWGISLLRTSHSACPMRWGRRYIMQRCMHVQKES